MAKLFLPHPTNHPDLVDPRDKKSENKQGRGNKKESWSDKKEQGGVNNFRFSTERGHKVGRRPLLPPPTAKHHTRGQGQEQRFSQWQTIEMMLVYTMTLCQKARNVKIRTPKRQCLCHLQTSGGTTWQSHWCCQCRHKHCQGGQGPLSAAREVPFTQNGGQSQTFPLLHFHKNPLEGKG